MKKKISETPIVFISSKQTSIVNQYNTITELLLILSCLLASENNLLFWNIYEMQLLHNKN